MLRRIRESGSEGAVFHVLRGCHLNSLDATKADRVLRRGRIPMLKVESEYDEGDLEQARTRIEAFVEMIKARREQTG
jgi:benzoyl-CoA reductase/2-hydroxyglutaryl-CoA dehydratase subunit BcrC/BadD/HgdB